MSMYERYHKFLAGEYIKDSCNEEQDFFKTCPTDKQIIVLDRHIKKQNLRWGVLVLSYLFIGIAIGFGIGLMY